MAELRKEGLVTVTGRTRAAQWHLAKRQ
jgi:hypothetical protein